MGIAYMPPGCVCEGDADCVILHMRDDDPADQFLI